MSVKIIDRAALSHPVRTGISREHLGGLIGERAGPRLARLRDRPGKKKQDTMKPTVIGDGDGRLVWTGAIRPGRMHDVSAPR